MHKLSTRMDTMITTIAPMAVPEAIPTVPTVGWTSAGSSEEAVNPGSYSVTVKEEPVCSI